MAAPSIISTPDPRELERKRAVLFSARIQLGPETQPIREKAIDRLVQHELLAFDQERGISQSELYAHSAAAGFRISQEDLSNSLDRLSIADRIHKCGVIKPLSYRLNPEIAKQLWATQNSCEERIRTLLGKLFNDAPKGWRVYEAAFIWCIAKIFSELGEAYARLLRGGYSKDDLLASPNIASAIDQACALHPTSDRSLLHRGIVRFFQYEDPDANLIKWNLAQNYYIAKALGLDPTGSLLSEEMLGGAEFYLDTNVLVTALAPQEGHHERFLAISEACKKLDIRLRFCQISLEELRHVTALKEEMIHRLDGKVGELLESRIDDVFFSIYTDARNAGKQESAFEHFYAPTNELDVYDAERIDDKWFTAESDAILNDELYHLVQRASASRIRAKTEKVAKHDALLLKWIHVQRQQSGAKIWLLTKDRTLPKVVLGSERFAVTLDAMLQWIAPALRNDSVDNFVTLFAESLRFQLLPQDNFLDLQDFCLLLDMGLSCDVLPPQDVENCIRHLRAVAPGLDPTNPSDREKLHHQIARFFADPGREHHKNLERLRVSKDAEIVDLRAQIAEHKNLLTDKFARISKLEGSLEQTAKDIELRRVKVSGVKRLIGSFSILLTALIFLAWLIYDPTHKENVLRQVQDAWPLFTPVGLVGLAAASWFVGTERLRALGLKPHPSTLDSSEGDRAE